MLTAVEDGTLLRVVSGSAEEVASLRKVCSRRPNVPRGFKPSSTGWIRVEMKGRELGWLTAVEWRALRRKLRLQGADISPTH